MQVSPQRRIQSRRVAAHDKWYVESVASKTLELQGLLEDTKRIIRLGW